MIYATTCRTLFDKVAQRHDMLHGNNMSSPCFVCLTVVDFQMACFLQIKIQANSAGSPVVAARF